MSRSSISRCKMYNFVDHLKYERETKPQLEEKSFRVINHRSFDLAQHTLSHIIDKDKDKDFVDLIYDE